MKLDILAIGAHPDDVELGCAGTLLRHISLGYQVGILDLTRGELGTRGSAEIRDEETRKSSDILGVAIRENLGFADGFFTNDKEHQLAIVRMVRKYQPDIVLANALTDRHPDHGRAGHLIAHASFLAGLSKIETELDGQKQERWRPRAIYHYIQFRETKPDIVVDISEFIEQKMEAVKAFTSQFHDSKSKEPSTVISSPNFLEFVTARARMYGKDIGVKYAEGFTSERMIGTNNLKDLL